MSASNGLTVEGFNHAVKIGDRVIYRNDFGEAIKTRTRTEATILGGHTAVVWVECRTRCVALARVHPIVEEPLS